MALTPDSRDQPILRAPAATVWLIVVLAAAHVARILAPAQMADDILWGYGFVPARYSPTYLALHHGNPGNLFDQAIPFVSYMFLHADFTHLVVNCVWLLAFGSLVARRLGAGLFFALFFVCGIAGAAAHLLCDWGSAVPAIGASAAISGLMGVAFRLLPLSPFPEGGPALAPLFSRRIMVWSAVWVGVNVLAGWLGLGVSDTARLIAWQAHLGGYFAGLLLAGPAVSYHDGRSRPA
jgi:membrane associated rhomboid family serine protease